MRFQPYIFRSVGLVDTSSIVYSQAAQTKVPKCSDMETLLAILLTAYSVNGANIVSCLLSHYPFVGWMAFDNLVLNGVM